MFGIEKKYHIYINDEEYDCIFHCLIDLKNNLLMQDDIQMLLMMSL